MIKLHLLAFIPMMVLSVQTTQAQIIRNNPPALEEKNSMPNATYMNKYLGPQIEVTRGTVNLTQGYNKNQKNNFTKPASAILKNDQEGNQPIEIIR